MESGYSGIGEEQYHSRGEHGFHLFPSQNGYTHDFVALSDTHVALALHVSRHAGIDQCLLHSRLPPTQDCIVVYNTHSRREVRRKQLDIQGGVALIRHMTTLDSSTLVCSTGHEVLLAPTGLKPKNE